MQIPHGQCRDVRPSKNQNTAGKGSAAVHWTFDIGPRFLGCPFIRTGLNLMRSRSVGA